MRAAVETRPAIALDKSANPDHKAPASPDLATPVPTALADIPAPAPTGGEGPAITQPSGVQA